MKPLSLSLRLGLSVSMMGAALALIIMSLTYAEKDAKGSIYVGLMKEKVTTRVITNAKNKMLKHYKDADPDTAVLISASYLGFMKPSEFDPNWLGELLE